MSPTPPVPHPVPHRILVCPQEFKGSLDAAAAARAIAEGIRRTLPNADVVEMPMADGGPGTMAIIATATGATLVEAPVVDAYRHAMTATYALLPTSDGQPGETVAVIESAAAVALAATPVSDRVPMRSTSRGVGMLIAHAAARGATQVILGVGGTASSDGGAGAARALGLRLVDANGDELPDEAAPLVRLAAITDGVPGELRHLRVRIAVDVRNHLTGPEGAAAIFGAQKGLLEWQTPALDAAVRHWADAVRTQLGREVDAIEGAGAGGGIPAGILATLPGTTIESGAELVATLTGLEAAIASADLVVTGEGSLDAQTAFGKAVAHVASLARQHGIPCLAVAGSVEALPDGIRDAEPLARTPDEVAAAIASAETSATNAAKRLLRRYVDGDTSPRS